MNQQNNTPDPAEKAIHNQGNAIKNPDNWSTGDEPMTGAQHSYLHTLADEAGVSVDDHMSKAAASKKIDELQEQTGRGQRDAS